MSRIPRLLVGVALLAGGILLGLYGLFAILYRGDSGGGDTYVKLAGREVDADLVGAVSLVLALAAILVAVALLRRRKRAP
jgi:hypothetical protein